MNQSHFDGWFRLIAGSVSAVSEQTEMRWVRNSVGANRFNSTLLAMGTGYKSTKSSGGEKPENIFYSNRVCFVLAAGFHGNSFGLCV